MSARLNSITFTARLVSEVCCSCGVCFGVPYDFQQMRLKDKRSFYCPNGHAQSYTQSEADRVREEMQQRVDAETNRAEFWKRESEQNKQKLTTAKGQLTKIKKRVGNGICPICNRSFTALRRHMQGQHPDYCDDQRVTQLEGK